MKTLKQLWIIFFLLAFMPVASTRWGGKAYNWTHIKACKVFGCDDWPYCATCLHRAIERK